MDKYGEDGIGYVADGETANSVYMYDPCVDTWSSSIPSMQSTRCGLGVAVLNDRIYAVGGMKTFGDEDGCLETAEVLDMTEGGTQEWRNIASLNNKRGGVGVGVLNGKIFAVGGSCDGRQRFSSVESYDPETNVWSPVADMAIQRFGAGVGVLNGVLYCVGGQTANPDRKNFCTKTVEKYCEDTNTWSQVAEMNHFRIWPGVLTHEGRLYVVGGYSGDILFSMEMYDPITNTWTLVGDMTVGRRG